LRRCFSLLVGPWQVIAAVAGLWLLACAARAYAVDNPPPDPSRCHPKALATEDNDIRIAGDDRPSGKPVPMPLPVVQQIRNEAKAVLARVPAGTADDLTCKDLLPDTYRISEQQGRQLFVAHVYVGLDIGYFCFILYDPATGKVTQHPPEMSAKWTEGFGAKDELMKPPFVSTADLFRNRQPQIVFEERVHNGDVYNAVIYHYFAVGPDLSLIRILALETRLLALDPNDGLFVRELTHVSDFRLRLDTFKVDKKGSSKRTELGYVLLGSSSPDTPFHVLERHPVDPKKFDCLVTCMDESPGEDAFLRKGNTFYY
jgi:hypothetical protein